MPISDDVALRGFLARLLGWKDERVIDNALRSVDLAVNHGAQLALCGSGDLVPIIWPPPLTTGSISGAIATDCSPGSCSPATSW